MKQLYIRWERRQELEDLIAALQEKGYRNIRHLDANYSFPVVVADLNEKVFFGTNTTCMAAIASCQALQTYSLTAALSLLEN